MHRHVQRSGTWVLLLVGSGLLWSALLACGTPGAPKAPSLNLPLPVANLTAARSGDSVHLAWTMPLRTTDHLPLNHAIPVDVCRGVAGLPCANVSHLLLAPGAAGVYDDRLSPDLLQGPQRLLGYRVILRNRAGKAAPSDSVAYSAAGPAPPAISGLSGEVQRAGVALSWQPAPNGAGLFRIQRRLLTSASQAQTPVANGPRSAMSPPVPSADQTLAVHTRDGVDPGHALDTSAVFGQQYRYLVTRVATMAFDGHAVEVQGAESDGITVATTDTFAPAIPLDLAAVADAAAGAIDLSWTPDSESDLAAYRVYRHEAQGGLPLQRIADTGVQSSFRDTGVQRGHSYRYAVSAIDQTGNESQPSPEVEETLPQP